MNPGRRLYIASLFIFVVISFFLLLLKGLDYYQTPLEERVYLEKHTELKPSGVWGHGFGIIGSFCMLFGVGTYLLRKRWRRISRFGVLKHWLEFHMFLCTLGPVLVLFHTAFKFGGIVAVSFWSMVAVFASGIIGRFIYIQIPRTIEGREMSLAEVQNLSASSDFSVPEGPLLVSYQNAIGRVSPPPGGFFLTRVFRSWMHDRRRIKILRMETQKISMAPDQRKALLNSAGKSQHLNRRIDRLLLMQKLFRYWHVAHLPFAIVMLVIMILHVVVTLTFGYRWIF